MTRIVTKLTVTIGIYFARSTKIRMTSPRPRNPWSTGTPLATRLMMGPAPPRCLYLAPTWRDHMAPSTPAAHLTGSACMMLCGPLECPISGVPKYLWPTNLTSPNGAIMRIVSRTWTCRIYWHTAFPWTTLPLISHIRSLAITRQQHIILNMWILTSPLSWPARPFFPPSIPSCLPHQPIDDQSQEKFTPAARHTWFVISPRHLREHSSWYISRHPLQTPSSQCPRSKGSDTDPRCRLSFVVPWP